MASVDRRDFGFILCAFILLCYSELKGINADYDYGYGGGGGYGPVLHSTYGIPSPLVSKLRSRIEGLDLDSYYTSDRQLARYIESSSFNVEHAAKLLTKTAEWRKSSGANNILDWPPPSFVAKHFPYECTGFTDEGIPVFYLPIGKWNFQAVFKAGLGSEIYKYYIRMLETIRRSTLGRVNPKTGEPVDQVVIIENLDGYSFKSLLTIRNNQFITILRYLRNIDRYYPFLPKKYLAVKASVTFTHIVWPIVRKTTPRLRQVFHIYNRFSNRGSDELFHTVPRRLIPIELGGTYISRVSHS